MAKQATLEWKRRKYEDEGLCLNCYKRPAGGQGGTLTACPECAQRKRDNATARLLRLAQSNISDLPKARKYVRSRGKVQTVEPNVERMLALSERLAALERVRANG